jgi:hypothetical protein
MGGEGGDEAAWGELGNRGGDLGVAEGGGGRGGGKGGGVGGGVGRGGTSPGAEGPLRLPEGWVSSRLSRPGPTP